MSLPRLPHDSSLEDAVASALRRHPSAISPRPHSPSRLRRRLPFPRRNRHGNRPRSAAGCGPAAAAPPKKVVERSDGRSGFATCPQGGHFLPGQREGRRIRSSCLSSPALVGLGEDGAVAARCSLCLRGFRSSSPERGGFPCGEGTPKGDLVRLSAMIVDQLGPVAQSPIQPDLECLHGCPRPPSLGNLC